MSDTYGTPMNRRLPDSSKLLTATIHKEYGTDGGIRLRTLAGKLITSHVTPSTVRSTGLKRGLHVLTMNNVDCSVLSDVSAQKLLEGDEMVTFLCKELESSLAPGALCTAVLNKEDVDTPVGMGLKVIDGQVCVGTIKPGSMAAGSDLRTNMRIKSINNFDCVGLNASQAATLLADAKGALEIMAQNPGGESGARMTDHVTVTINVSDEVDIDNPQMENDDICGVELMVAQSLEDGTPLICVKSIAKSSVFYGSALRVGMQVCKVQNIDCTKAKAEAVMHLLEDSIVPGENITVLARNCGNLRRAPGSFMTVVVTKESAESKLGVVLATKGGKIFIKKIADGTLGSTTELEQGMWVHSINNVSLSGKGSGEAAEILSLQEGLVTFLVQTPGGANLTDPSLYVTATMVKEEGDKVGIAIKVENEQMVITKNSEGGLAHPTALEVGMRITNINNVPMAGKTNKFAVGLLKETEGILTILAQKPERPAGTYVVAAIEIPTVAPGEKKPPIGIKIADSKDGKYTITGVTPDSLASQTELRPGMVLKSVNNVDCASKKKLRDMLSMFQQTSGVLNILCCMPGAEPELPCSQVVTGTVITGKQVPAGSLVFDEVERKINVTDTGAAGTMFGTAIRAGMEILSINNVEASLFSKVGLENILESQDRLVFLAKRQELPPDILITETIHKETPQTPMGIGIRAYKGKIFISSIKDGTLASTTKFLPGMELVSIDNEDCMGMDALVIAKALRDSVGDVTIVASTKGERLSKNAENVSLVTAILQKGEKENKVGIGFVRKRGMLVITKIVEGTVAAESDLLVGMDVLSINNVDVTEMSSKEASTLLSEADGVLTILAKRPALPPGSFVTAAIIKESPEMSLGIKLAGLKGGGVMIKFVTPQSPASFTELEEGMILRSINNVNTTTLATKDVAKLLTAHVSPMTILAQTTKEVAMGRASFRSMRSLTSARSLADTIASDYSGQGSKSSGPTNMYQEDEDSILKKEIHEVSDPSMMKKPIVVRSSSPEPTNPIKSISPPDSPVIDTGLAETITVISGGKRASFTVRNVVDC